MVDSMIDSRMPRFPFRFHPSPSGPTYTAPVWAYLQTRRISRAKPGPRIPDVLLVRSVVAVDAVCQRASSPKAAPRRLSMGSHRERRPQG